MSLNANRTSVAAAAPAVRRFNSAPSRVGPPTPLADIIEDKWDDHALVSRSSHAEKLAAIKKVINIPGGPPMHPQLVKIQDAILNVAAFCAEPKLTTSIVNHAKNRARDKAFHDHCLVGRYERHAAKVAYVKDKHPKTRRFTRWTSGAMAAALFTTTMTFLPMLGCAIADSRSEKRINNKMTPKQVRKHEVARQLERVEQGIRAFRKNLNPMQLAAEAPDSVLRASGAAVRHMYATVLVPACESLPEDAGQTPDVHAALFGVRHQIDKLDHELKRLPA